MNILIITHYYEIDGVMGSVRWTSLAHRLSKKHNVYIVTHAHQNIVKQDEDSGKNIKVIYIDNECGYAKRSFSKSSSSAKSSAVSISNKRRKKNFIKSIIKSSLYMMSMRLTSFKNAEYICRQLEEEKVKFDCVISTSRPFINCFTAFNVVKKWKIPWLLDQRDLPYTDGTPKSEINAYKYALRRFDKFVSKYTLVSKGMADSFIEFCKFGKKQEDKTVVLNNGYDTTHKSELEDRAYEPVLSIAYAGDLYEGKRDATILFDALNEVMKDDEFSVSDVRIKYAGGSSKSLVNKAKEHGFEEMIVDYGRVPHKEAIKMQQEADLLLLLTWNTYMDRGILPGKLYEYMMAKKPIVCITSGEIPNGEAEGMINSMNLGVAVNYIDYDEGVKKLASFISKQLLNKKQNKPIEYSPDENKVSQFDYDNLVKKLESIMFGDL